MSLHPSHEASIREALEAAEDGHQGRISVVVDAEGEGDVDRRALEVWRELELDDVSVLVFVALDLREVRTVAGPRVLAGADDGFWQAVADEVADGFRAGDPPAGVRRALDRIARLLRTIVPDQGRDSDR